MADKYTTEQRTRIMKRVSKRDTGPEKIVRSLLHQLGFRFRLYRRDLPGCPDIVLPRHRKAIQVHGCFWHGHRGCRRAARPSSNTTFWHKKLDRNIERDKQTLRELTALGWKVLVLWECQIGNPERLRSTLTDFMNRQ
jgi:DNA mismatch endonuclease (patch repair protein)